MFARSLILAFALAACACSGERPARGVLFVTLDTTRADRLGAYGYASASTPNLDALAARGVRFAQAQSTAPITLPAHASMFTGLYPPVHGVRYNGTFRVADERTTLAEVLKGAGFDTAAVPAAFPVAADTGLAQGFDRYEDLFSGPDRASLPDTAQRSAADVSRLGEAWLREHARGRFFLWLHYYDPHDPYEPPAPWNARFQGRPYDGEIAYVDNEVGRVLRALTELGALDDTLIVVAGDHGEGLGDHREPTHKNLVYQSTMHVPLIVKPPGRSVARVVEEPVSLVDLMPTVLDYAGVPAPAEVQGVSLRPAIAGDAATRRPLYFESLAGALSFGWAPLHGLRRGPYKFIEAPTPELYDLGADPGESSNLHGTHAEVAADLRGELRAASDAWEKAAGSESAAAPMDAETRDRLASLGYLGGGALPSRDAGGRDPKELAHLEGPLLEGKRRSKAQDWPGAIAIFRNVLREDPDNRFALGEAANAAIAVKAFEDAETFARRMSERYPDEVQGWTLLADALLEQRRPVPMAEAMTRAVGHHPEDRGLRYRLVLALFLAGRDADAVSAARATPAGAAVAMPATRVVEAAALLRMREAAAADAALERAIAEGFRNRGMILGNPAFAPLRNLPAYRTLP
ncbi:MAG TPA: sulfatase-like hydrolase/transferase [Candidatus Polarisedimenticolaceae bacterium]